MKKILFSLMAALFLASCVDLDVPPKNIVTEVDLLTNESGMGIYMARLYSNMPFEDFKYMGEWGFEYNGWLAATGVDGTGEAVTRDGICKSFTGERTAYWGKAFTLIRDANFVLTNLPKYRGSHSEVNYNHYMGEAYFVRAMAFYAMAKRFGGIPLVTRLIEYPASIDKLEIPRATEEQTWDQIAADFTSAASLLAHKSPVKGYSNKYVALAFKAEAMLYAGSVAKYNQGLPQNLTGFGRKTRVRVIGFAEDTWKEASKRYFTEAFKAANEVMKNGGYSLYKKKWKADDAQAQYENMVEMFSDLTSPENIFVREYKYPVLTHGYDAYSAPRIFSAPLSSGTCPTLDFVELFDGFDRYENGTIKVTTGANNTTGTYVMYDKPMDFFADAEPRLRAYVIFPGDVFKGREIEIRAGIYTGTTPVSPLFSDYSYSKRDIKYQNLDAYKGEAKTLHLSAKADGGQTIVDLGDAGKMTAGGANGPCFDEGETSLTGLYARKWLNPDPSFVAGEGKSAQPFILIRYADVLLAAAESAVELALVGESTVDGENLLGVATQAIKDIRERAGAQELNASLTATNDSRNIVRKERRKELAFEHKTKWDLRRWRVLHYDKLDGFWGETRDKNSFSDGNQVYMFRGLYPFYSSSAKKYFFDARFQWVATKDFSYNVVDYYFGIPSNEVAKSSYIDQQPNR